MHENGERVKNVMNEKYKRESKMERLEMRMKKWYNQPFIGYIIAIITLFFAVYQWKENQAFEKNIVSLENKVDSLNTKHDSLNIQYDSLEKKLSDLKTKTEQKK